VYHLHHTNTILENRTTNKTPSVLRANKTCFLRGFGAACADSFMSDSLIGSTRSAAHHDAQIPPSSPFLPPISTCGPPKGVHQNLPSPWESWRKSEYIGEALVVLCHFLICSCGHSRESGGEEPSTSAKRNSKRGRCVVLHTRCLPDLTCRPRV